MTPLHQRVYSDIVDGTVLMAKFREAGSPRRVELPEGRWKGQKMSAKCAAFACRNALETADGHSDFPSIVLPEEDEIYELAERLVGLRNIQKAPPRLILRAMAESVCRLVDEDIRWMELPLDSDIFKAWLTVQKTGIAYGTVWTGGDETPLKRNLIPTLESVGPGHAIHIRGFDDDHWYRRFFWQKRTGFPAFIIENSHKFEGAFWYGQKRPKKHGKAAVVFVPPNY